MKTFDPSAVCSKCGSSDVSAVYHATSMSYGCVAPYGGGEHLDRVCRRCHFGWAEAVLATEEEEKP